MFSRICREYVMMCLVCTTRIIYIYLYHLHILKFNVAICTGVSTVLNTNNNTKEFNNSKNNNKDYVVTQQ